MKILGIAPIPTEELLKLRSECEALHKHIDNLLSLSYVETPAEENSKKEASSDPKAEPKKEASSEEEILPGIFAKKPSSKPFEMAIE